MTHFHILDLDTMGQGVAKADGQITFIAKTLPNEVVAAEVYRNKKNIHFAHMTEVLTPAPERQEAPCPHYAQCGGCDYQHVDTLPNWRSSKKPCAVICAIFPM